MKISRISVSRGCTINIGSYESQRAEVSMSAELGPEETVTTATESLTKIVEGEMANVIEKLPGCSGRSRDFVA